MEKVGRYWSRHLGIVVEDSDFAEEIDFKNLISCWERRDNSGEGETLYRIEECSSQTAWALSCRAAYCLLAKLEREN